MKTVISLSALLACACGGIAWADGMESSGRMEPALASEPLMPSDSRMKTLIYNETDVYTIMTRYGYQTSIVFGKGEEMQTISIGDRSLWQIIPNGNRLFIRPMEEGASTNMTVLTNKHSYQFDLKSLNGSKGGGNIYVARFSYPDERPKPPPALPVMVTTPAPQPALQAAPPVQAVPGFNYNYTYSGPDELAPLQVYDDGKSTYLKYRDTSQPIPNVYVVERGHENLTEVSVRGDTVVIDRISPEIILKNSNGAVHVYNETLNPG